MTSAPASLVAIALGFATLSASAQAPISTCYTSIAGGTTARECVDWMETSRMSSDVSFQDRVERFAAHGDKSQAASVAFLFDTNGVTARQGAGIGSFNDGMASRHPTAPQPISASLTGDRTDEGQSLIIESAVSAVPEPATYAIFLAGLGALLFMSRRRRM